MNKLFKFLIILLSILILLLGAAYYIFNTKIKNQILPESKKFIQEQTNLDVDFRTFKLSLSKLLQLEPSLKIEELQIENAIKIKKILVELYLKDLFKRKFVIKEILIDGAEVILAENAQRQVYLKGFEPGTRVKNLQAAKVQAASDAPIVVDDFLQSLSLKSLRVVNSRLEFNPYKSLKPLVFSSIEAELKDLEIAESKSIKARYKASAQLFNSSRSLIKAEGDFGPVDFSFNKIPVSGTETLSFYIKDMPEKLRQELLGDLVIVTNETALFQESKFAGDLISVISGQGNLKTNNLVIGNSTAHNLSVKADLPHSYRLELNKAPKLKLETKDSTINLATKDKQSGNLIFDAYIVNELDTGLLQGSSRGKLVGLELREVLNSVSKQRDLISGLFEIQDFNLSFQGKDAKEINKSLKASGSIAVNNGSLYILKSITKYKDIASSLISNGATVLDKIGGEFVSLTSDFEFNNGNLYNKAIELKTQGIEILGSGSLTQSEELIYDLNLNVTGLSSIPIKIRGTLAKPKIKPDIKQLGREQGEKLINDALKFGLDALMKQARPPAQTTSP